MLKTPSKRETISRISYLFPPWVRRRPSVNFLEYFGMQANSRVELPAYLPSPSRSRYLVFFLPHTPYAYDLYICKSCPGTTMIFWRDFCRLIPDPTHKSSSNGSTRFPAESRTNTPKDTAAFVRTSSHGSLRHLLYVVCSWGKKGRKAAPLFFFSPGD